MDRLPSQDSSGQLNDQPANSSTDASLNNQSSRSSNNRPGSNSSSAPDDDLSEPVTLNDIGLPENYDPRYIPTSRQLRDRALEALHEKMAFVIRHKDDHPELIVEQLDSIAGIAIAASQVPGDHQAKAIRLGLALELQYWLARNNLQGWMDLIVPLLTTSIEIHNEELQSEIYRVWAMYLYITREQPKAEKALSIALNTLEESDRDDLKLLARVEQMNAHVTVDELTDIEREAQAIITDAQRMEFTYVEARSHLSLARAYHYRNMFRQTFTHAQQALILFVRINHYAFAGESVNAMLNSLGNTRKITSYRQRLLDYLNMLARRSVSPWFQAVSYHHLSVQSYHAQRYDEARERSLKAWCLYHSLGRCLNCAEAEHMLGLIQTKRHQWDAAKRHLRSAYTRYTQLQRPTLAVNAYHALAFVYYEQGDLSRALGLLEEAKLMAEGLPNNAGNQLVSGLQQDIDDLRRKLDDGCQAAK